MRVTSSALAGISFFLLIPNAGASFVASLNLLDPNDLVSWSRLGDPGSEISTAFSTDSVAGVQVFGNFAQPRGGTVAEVCPAANCNYAAAPGLQTGDFLIWTEDADGNGTGPLTMVFSRPVQGAGVYLQVTAPSIFAAEITEIAASNTNSYSALSTTGDPLFLGVLDSAPDITGITIGGLSCAATSPGLCAPTDFAIDSVYLVTNVPESGVPISVALGLVLLLVLGGCRIAGPVRRRMLISFAAGGSILLSMASLARGQDPVPTPKGEEPLLDGANTARGIRDPDPPRRAHSAAQDSAPALPIWRYQIISPADGLSYSGYMVGSSPFNRGARSTTISVLLIPFIVSFTNTTTGFTTTFDPSSAPDAGCTANQTAMKLVEGSPIFQTQDWTLNGVYLGNTQYIDAFQRANFWQYVQSTGNAYHTLLDYAVGDPLPLSVNYASPTVAAEVRTGVQGSCTNPGGSGAVNGAGYQGIVDMKTLHDAMTGYILSHNISADQLPVFILYNVMYSQTGQIYLGGYHFSEASFPDALTSPGQTFVMANFRTNGTGPFDVSILSHEIAEWMDDPGGYNGVPAWGNIGEVSGCKRDLEVGDPLTRTDLPIVTGANGFGYHLQELAFFSWFFRTPSIGAGGAFSDNTTLTSDAGSTCQ